MAVKEWKWLKENPCQKVGRNQEPRGRVRWLNDNERNELLKVCQKSHWNGLHLLVLLALSTGARLGELIKLKWSDVDGARIYARETKNSETRILPLIPEVQRQLEEWGKVRQLGSDWVFPSPVNPKRVYTGWRAHWNKALKDAGIEDFRFHDLRHTCASYLAQNNVPLLTIAAILGHKTLAMVQRYAHLSDKAQADALNDVMSGKLG